LLTLSPEPALLPRKQISVVADGSFGPFAAPHHEPVAFTQNEFPVLSMP
jgi:hypothetical protein